MMFIIIVRLSVYPKGDLRPMKMKRLFCLVLSALMLVSILPVMPAHAEELPMPTLPGKQPYAGGTAPVLDINLEDYKNTDEVEPNNSSDTAMVVYDHMDILASVNSADQTDWYRVNLGSATALGIYTLSDLPVMLFGIVDSDGYVVDISSYYGTLEEMYVDGMEIILPAGTYYVLVMQTTYGGVNAYEQTMNYAIQFRGHTPSGTVTELEAATCENLGLAQFDCSECENTIQAHIPALGHNFSGGICSRCGEPDPDYSGETSDGVYRIAGSNRVETSLRIASTLKQEMGVSGFSSMVVASALNFPDALTGSYLAAAKSAPILLTYDAVQDTIVSYISANLASGGTVYILGGVTAVSSSFEHALRNQGINVRRLAGNDRFGTNLAILNEVGVPRGQNILVCTAFGFADSLSASATGMPILLVGKTLTQEQRSFLSRAGGSYTIIGGTGAVSAAVEKELRSYGSVNRLKGENRYQTSVLVAFRFFPAASDAVVAYAWNYPDGLCGGPLAYYLGAPLLLTDSVDATAGAYAFEHRIQTGYVLGGDSLITDDAARRIFSLLG